LFSINLAGKIRLFVWVLAFLSWESWWGVILVYWLLKLDLPVNIPIRVFNTVICAGQLVLSRSIDTSTMTRGRYFVMRCWVRRRNLPFSLLFVDGFFEHGIHIVSFFSRNKFLTMADRQTFLFKLFWVTRFFDGLCLSLQ
jgi:hypothetical protein